MSDFGSEELSTDNAKFNSDNGHCNPAQLQLYAMSQTHVTRAENKESNDEDSEDVEDYVPPMESNLNISLQRRSSLRPTLLAYSSGIDPTNRKLSLLSLSKVEFGTNRRRSIQFSEIHLPPVLPQAPTAEENEDDEDEEYVFPTNFNHQKRNSMASSIDPDITASRIPEDTKVKIGYMKDFWIALVSTTGLLWFFISLRSGGVGISFGGSFLRGAAAIGLEAWMSLNHYFTDQAFNAALAVYFGYQFSSPKGTSLSLCGFYHSGVLERLRFPSSLSAKTKVKRLVISIGILGLFHTLLHICILFGSVYLEIDSFFIDQGTLSCNEYHHDGFQFDRKWPVFELTVGKASQCFGASLGQLRVDDQQLKSSLFAMPPQILDKTVDSSTIYGQGFSARILTDCHCVEPIAEELSEYVLNQDDVFEMLKQYNDVEYHTGIISNIRKQNENITMYSLVIGTNVCGGFNITHTPLPLCTTSVYDFRRSVVSVLFTKDETNPSAFPREVNIKSLLSKANSTWLYNGLIYLHGGKISSWPLENAYPNSVNPILKWASVAKQIVNAAKIEEGLEAMVALLLRSSIQRSFLARGTICPKTVTDPERIRLKLGQTGFVFCMIFLISEILYLSAVFLVFCLWFASKHPLLPSIRFVQEKQYFTLLLSGLTTVPHFGDISPSMEKALYWSRLDIDLRVGESINTMDDPDIGHIAVDRPKKITYLSLKKEYE
jgi:hypothetical protein